MPALKVFIIVLYLLAILQFPLIAGPGCTHLGPGGLVIYGGMLVFCILISLLARPPKRLVNDSKRRAAYRDFTILWHIGFWLLALSLIVPYVLIPILWRFAKPAF